MDLSVSHTLRHLSNNLYVFRVEFGPKDVPQDLKEVNLRPVHLACAVDVSSSMASPAVANDPELSKFSRMDLVRHSLEMVRRCLRPEDSLSLVGFADRANTLMPPTLMDQRGKAVAERALLNLRPYGNTNLYDGLFQAATTFSSDMNVGSGNVSRHVLVLTDGEPNMDPPRGIVAEFVSQMQKRYGMGGALPFGLHTFGYGYSLDTRLLCQMAELSGGMFGHIPDHTMCSTVFSNFLANTLCAATPNIRIHLAGNNSNFKIISSESAENGIGSVAWDGRRSVLLVANLPNPQDFQIDLKIGDAPYVIRSLNSLNPDQTPTGALAYDTAVSSVLDIVRKGLQNVDLKKTYSDLETTCGAIRLVASRGKGDPQFSALLDNIFNGDPIKGQVGKAFSNSEWFSRWGVQQPRDSGVHQLQRQQPPTLCQPALFGHQKRGRRSSRRHSAPNTLAFYRSLSRHVANLAGEYAFANRPMPPRRRLGLYRFIFQ